MINLTDVEIQTLKDILLERQTDLETLLHIEGIEQENKSRLEQELKNVRLILKKILLSK